LKAAKAPTPRQKLGSAGERLAVARLAELGYEIITTNWRCSIGELDIVAWHAQCLVFIEVRTRRSRIAGTPEESITPLKQQRLLRLAEAFLQARPEFLAKNGEFPPCRIDLVAVELGTGGIVSRVEVLENIVQAE
jgi:putative endonuclease